MQLDKIVLVGITALAIQSGANKYIDRERVGWLVLYLFGHGFLVVVLNLYKITRQVVITESQREVL